MSDHGTTQSTNSFWKPIMPRCFSCSSLLDPTHSWSERARNQYSCVTIWVSTELKLVAHEKTYAQSSWWVILLLSICQLMCLYYSFIYIIYKNLSLSPPMLPILDVLADFVEIRNSRCFLYTCQRLVFLLMTTAAMEHSPEWLILENGKWNGYKNRYVNSKINKLEDGSLWLRFSHNYGSSTVSACFQTRLAILRCELLYHFIPSTATYASCFKIIHVLRLSLVLKLHFLDGHVKIQLLLVSSPSGPLDPSTQRLRKWWRCSGSCSWKLPAIATKIVGNLESPRQHRPDMWYIILTSQGAKKHRLRWVRQWGHP